MMAIAFNKSFGDLKLISQKRNVTGQYYKIHFADWNLQGTDLTFQLCVVQFPNWIGIFYSQELTN